MTLITTVALGATILAISMVITGLIVTYLTIIQKLSERKSCLGTVMYITLVIFAFLFVSFIIGELFVQSTEINWANW